MKYNFSAGPAVLPSEVSRKLSTAVIDFKNKGISILSLSHRSDDFFQILTRTELLIRKLLSISHSYKVLFMQGGATFQFALIPNNLMHCYRKAFYIDTGHWSKKAADAARSYGEVEISYSSSDMGYTYIPSFHILDEKFQGADYLHITSNNTVYGTRFSQFPKLSIPLVADMSSDIMTRKLNIDDFGCIYAGAQKNLGVAGLGVVVIKEELIRGREALKIPEIFSYASFAAKQSLVHTPPVFAIYAAQLMLEWVEQRGGIEEMERQSIFKSNLLYDFIDQSDLFYSPVNKPDRSFTNVIFYLKNISHQNLFDQICRKRNIVYIKGHRVLGGYRASIYNVTPLKWVEVLIEAMKEFQKKAQRQKD